MTAGYFSASALGMVFLGATALTSGCGSSSANAGSSAAASSVVYSATSAEIVAALNAPAAVSAARAAWTTVSQLSPAEYHSGLMASVSNVSFVIDGVAVGGLYGRMLANQPLFESLSERYSTMGSMFDANNMRVSFTITETELKSALGSLTSAGLDLVTPAECGNYARRINSWNQRQKNDPNGYNDFRGTFHDYQTNYANQHGGQVKGAGTTQLGMFGDLISEDQMANDIDKCGPQYTAGANDTKAPFVQVPAPEVSPDNGG